MIVPQINGEIPRLMTSQFQNSQPSHLFNNCNASITLGAIGWSARMALRMMRMLP
jgi:hypothetical protein